MAATKGRRSPMKGKRRPLSIALNIVLRMPEAGQGRLGDRRMSARSHARLVQILKERNAASGTSDERSAARRRHTLGKRK